MDPIIESVDSTSSKSIYTLASRDGLDTPIITSQVPINNKKITVKTVLKSHERLLNPEFEPSVEEIMNYR
jgi:hypothetical protein